MKEKIIQICKKARRYPKYFSVWKVEKSENPGLQEGETLVGYRARAQFLRLERVARKHGIELTGENPDMERTRLGETCYIEFWRVLLRKTDEFEINWNEYLR